MPHWGCGIETRYNRLRGAAWVIRRGALLSLYISSSRDISLCLLAQGGVRRVNAVARAVITPMPPGPRSADEHIGCGARSVPGAPRAATSFRRYKAAGARGAGSAIVSRSDGSGKLRKRVSARRTRSCAVAVRQARSAVSPMRVGSMRWLAVSYSRRAAALGGRRNGPRLDATVPRSAPHGGARRPPISRSALPAPGEGASAHAWIVGDFPQASEELVQA